MNCTHIDLPIDFSRVTVLAGSRNAAAFNGTNHDSAELVPGRFRGNDLPDARNGKM